MKEAVENKKAELKQSGKEIPAKDVDVFQLIDSSYLYGLINDGIDKYCLIIQILLLLLIMITKRLQVTKQRKPNLSLYMKTTMIL